MWSRVGDALWVSIKSCLSWAVVCTGIVGLQFRSLDLVVPTAVFVPLLVLPSVLVARLMGLRTRREVREHDANSREVGGTFAVGAIVSFIAVMIVIVIMGYSSRRE
jgi:hypothetical protein